MKFSALRLVANHFLGDGPCRVAAFETIAAGRMHDYSRRIHRPECQAAVVATAAGDSVFVAGTKSLLGQDAEPERIDTHPRYHAAGLFAALHRELWLMDDAAAAGADGAVWCPLTRTLVAETARHWSHGAEAHPLLFAPRFPQPTPLPGLTLHLGTPGATGFYHFLIESLPKLAFARAFLSRVDRLLVNGRPGGFQEHWLRFAGIDPARIRWLEGLSHFRCEQLLFARTLVEDLRPTPWIIAQIRSLFSQPPAPTGSGRRLWISRVGAAFRNPIWESQLLRLLPDFERVDLAALTPAEQVSLFAAAEVVAGPHGAGFANLVFSQPDTRVIEIMPDLRHIPLYARLAAAARLSHAWLAADFMDADSASLVASAIKTHLGSVGP